MISYASIDRVVDDKVIVEMEMHTTVESYSLSPKEKIVGMIVLNKEMFPIQYAPYCEGDILIVNHNGGRVIEICGKDEEEKARRIQARKK